MVDHQLRTDRESLAARIGNYSARAASALGRHDWRNNPNLARDFLAQLAADRAVLCTELMSGVDRRVVVAQPPSVGCKGRKSEGHELTLPIGDGGEATLVVRFSDEELTQSEELQATLASSVIAVSFILSVIAATIGFRFIVGRPLNLLVAAIQHSAETGDRVPIRLRRRDELGVVITAFNQMIERDTARQAELAEIELRRRMDGRLLTLLDASPLPMLATRATDATIVYLNEPFAETFGWPQGEAIGQRSLPIYVDPGERQRIVDQVDRDGKVIGHEFRARKLDGTEFWAAISVQPVELDGVRTMLGSFYDITDRKDAEKALLDSIETIRQSRTDLDEKTRFLRAVLDSAPEGICVYDDTLRLVMWNDRFAAALGMPKQWLEAGRTIEEIIAANIALGHMRRDRADEIASIPWPEIRECGDGLYRHEMALANGTHLEIRGRAMPQGGVVATFADITDRKKAEATIQRLAMFDPLTGLANRNVFQQRLEASINSAQHVGNLVALMLLDLDKFKDVNDTYGHPVGDRLLQAVAERLKESFRKSDTVARLGGDEFAVIVTNLKNTSDIIRPARMVIDTLSKPFSIDDQTLNTNTSIGITIFPNDDTEPDELMRKSDVALYEAKNQGRGVFRLYNAEIDEAAKKRAVLEQELQMALANEEFILHYQPIVDAGTHKLVGFEALVRWNHSERGLVPPAEFIPTLEAMGLIVPLGRLVLRKACIQAQAWTRSDFPVFRMAVNVSAREFQSDTFVENVKEALAESGLPAPCLELEISEGVVIHDPEATIESLNELKAVGIMLAIDDFGTGFSSLAYLKRFPVDRLKIDRTFIDGVADDRHDSSIVEAAISLGHALDLEVVAEGVEDRRQLSHLMAMGCDEIQGFFFSKPLTAEEIPGLLQTWLSQDNPASADRTIDVPVPS